MDKAKKNRLKAQAHHLNPVILVGAKGITAPLIEEADGALQAHELIKIKVYGEDKHERKEMAMSLCEALEAEFIQLIGNIAVVYRKKKKT